jgi:hypothetical protein
MSTLPFSTYKTYYLVLIISVSVLFIFNERPNIGAFAKVLEHNYPINEKTAATRYGVLSGNYRILDSPSYYTAQLNQGDIDDDNDEMDVTEKGIIMLAGKIMTSQFSPIDMKIQKLILGNFSTSSSGQELLVEFGIYDPQNDQPIAAKVEKPNSVFSIGNLSASSIQETNNNMIQSGVVDVVMKSIRSPVGSSSNSLKHSVVKSWKNVPATVSVIPQDIGGLFILNLGKSSSVSKLISNTPIVGTITMIKPSPSSLAFTTDSKQGITEKSVDQKNEQIGTFQKGKNNRSIQQNNVTGNNIIGNINQH